MIRFVVWLWRRHCFADLACMWHNNNYCSFSFSSNNREQGNWSWPTSQSANNVLTRRFTSKLGLWPFGFKYLYLLFPCEIIQYSILIKYLLYFYLLNFYIFYIFQLIIYNLIFIIVEWCSEKTFVHTFIVLLYNNSTFHMLYFNSWVIFFH